MGSQHPSPNVKNLCNFETQIWLEIITSRDAESTCFKGSLSKQGSTPTPWARGLRDQIQKWALQAQKTLYF